MSPTYWGILAAVVIVWAAALMVIFLVRQELFDFEVVKDEDVRRLLNLVVSILAPAVAVGLLIWLACDRVATRSEARAGIADVKQSEQLKPAPAPFNSKYTPGPQGRCVCDACRKAREVRGYY